MRLSAALLPPRTALEELAAVVREVAPATPELDPVPVESMHVLVTHFGNVARRDVADLVRALRLAAEQWPRPRLHFAGSAALEWPGDLSVWARIRGEEDRLNAVGRGVPPAVQRLGFLVDRRQFRPWLPVGQITDETTAPYLHRLVDALDGFRGRSWTLPDLCVLERVPTEPGAREHFEVLERLPLAQADASAATGG